jgi:hypothetical protein
VALIDESIRVGESFFVSTDRPVDGTDRCGWGGIGVFGVGEALTRCLPVGAKERPGRAPMWHLEALAREAGVRPLMEFLHEDEWFTAAEGLATVRGLLDYLTTHTEGVAEVRRVIGDLRALEQLLRRLEREGIRWRLVDGSRW